MSTMLDMEIAIGDLTDRQFDHYLHARTIAWDIETSGLDWRKDRIGTVQLSDREGQTVVVQLSSGEPTRLRRLLATPAVRKIFHHAPFDLRFMSHHWSISPANIACTKVAAKIVLPGEESGSYSLKPLLLRLLQVRVDKGLQQSDWLAERLSDEQLRYASEDVRHLHALLERLEDLASHAGLAKELNQSFEYIPTRVALELHGSGDVFAY